MKDQTLILTPSVSTTPSNSTSSVVDPSFGSKKTRVTIKYQNVEETVGWYGNTTPSTIEEAIKTVFQLPFDVRLFLKDQDGDVVAISPTLPAGETFTLYLANKPSSGSPTSSSSSNSTTPMIKSLMTPITESISPSSSNLSISHHHHHHHHHVDEASTASSRPSSFSSDSSSSSRLPPSPSSSSMGSPDQTFKTLDTDVTEISTSDSPDIDSKKRDSIVEEEDDEDDPRKKRKRRKAVEIDRSFKCSMANCQKIYGSENALKMHIKLKHPEYQYLIMQQQTPMSQKSTPIIVNNKLLNFGNHPIQPSQQQQQQQQQQSSTPNINYQRSPIQQSQQQRISTSYFNDSQSSSNGSSSSLKYAPLPDMNPRDIMMLSKQYSQQQQQQQPTQHHNQNNNNNSNSSSSNYKGVLPKLFNNSQVPTSTLKMHLASFLAKEKSNKQQQQQQQQSSSSSSPSPSPSSSSNDIQGLFNAPINKIINSQLMPNNLDPTFFKNFQNQLNTLAASNPAIAQDILNYDIEALSDYIKKQIDHLKVGNNSTINNTNGYDSSSKYHHLSSYANNNNVQNNNNNINQEEESDQEDSDFDYQLLRHHQQQQQSHHNRQQQQNHHIHNLVKQSTIVSHPSSPTQQKGNLSFLVDKENFESSTPSSSSASSNRDTCTKLTPNNTNNPDNHGNFTSHNDSDVAVAASLLGLHKTK